MRADMLDEARRACACDTLWSAAVNIGPTAGCGDSDGGAPRPPAPAPAPPRLGLRLNPTENPAALDEGRSIFFFGGVDSTSVEEAEAASLRAGDADR